MTVKPIDEWTTKDYRVALAIQPTAALLDALLDHADRLERTLARLRVCVRVAICLN